MRSRSWNLHFYIIAGGSPTVDADKPATSVSDIQCLLDNVGATEMVIELIVNTKNDRLFKESIELGIALLRGGNTQIQVCFTDTRILYFSSTCFRSILMAIFAPN